MSREIVFMNSRIAPKSVAAREEIAVEEGHGEEETRDRDDVILMFEKCLSLSDEISEVDTQQRSQEVSARESARETSSETMMPTSVSSIPLAPTPASKGAEPLSDDAAGVGGQGSSLLGYWKLGMSAVALYSIFCLYQYVQLALE